ncbi:unnamed protein product [Ilex paraguariensis]|uniref:Uncharacterized protein n=1 Tax=Ilex paraguariensis TaxID=185542 RepID=A0ABC8QSP9_9AQUA
MADYTHSDSSETRFTNDPKIHIDYPVPLSPPLPSVSKDIELSRAMSASSKSGLFSVSRSDVLFEDQWLIAVNKPQGVYCESVLSSVPSLLNVPTDSDTLGKCCLFVVLNARVEWLIIDDGDEIWLE